MNNMRGDDARVAYSLFPDEEGGSTPTSPLHFHIDRIGHQTAKLWVEKWHYSRRIPTGQNISYGLYANGELYAVIVYGVGVNPYQAKFLGVESVIEIKRMCRREPRLDFYPLSRFIALTSKMVRRVLPYDCIVAFADPEHGHEGTVYRASGFRLHGTTNAEWHVEDGDGNRRHRRLAFRHSRREHCTVAESRSILGLRRVQTKPKMRFVRP